MTDFFQSADTWMFYAINHGMSNPFFDWLMPVITDRTTWFPVWGVVVLALVIYYLRQKRYQGLWSLLLIAVIITASDQISSSLIKPSVERIRPSNALEDVNLLVPRTKSYSFPSSHATNFFAAAAFFTWLVPRGWVWYFLIAMIVSLSRTYVGVHYPGDLLGGAVIGVITAVSVVAGYRFLEKKYKWSSIVIK